MLLLWIEWFHLVVPPIQITTVRDGIFQFGAPDRASIGRKLTTEVWVVVLTGLIKGSDIAIAPAPLAVGFRIVCVQVVAS